MKKIKFILPVLLVFCFVLPAFAVKNSSSENPNSNTGQQIQSQIVSSPIENQVQNQNQVQTQNQGEDSQIHVSTQELESLEVGRKEGLQTRNQNAVEHMNQVATQVQQLLQVQTTGGIGEQVRQIAQEQNQAQTQIQEQVYKLDSKGKFARLLTGTDYGAVKNLKAHLVQNQLRIRQLTQLQNQLANWQDATVVQETINALIQENTSLQERITAEEQTKSVFGWLFRFFTQ